MYTQYQFDWLMLKHLKLYNLLTIRISLSNMLTVGTKNVSEQLIGKEKKDDIILSSSEKKIINQDLPNSNILENKKIKIIKIKEKLSRDGSNKVYITYRQKSSYKPSEIMIDWLDSDGVPFDGIKKYSKSKVRADEIRSISFYKPEIAFDFRVKQEKLK